MLPEAVANQDVPPDPALRELQALLVRVTGNYRLTEQISPLLESAERRRRLLGVPSLSAYLALLRDSTRRNDELDTLVAELTVGETSFLRHPEQFDALRELILPACLERNKASRQLRIWSAGCSNGAEAYSIAIIVRSLLGEQIADWNVAIVGSDVNRTFLEDAERGRYSAWAFRNTPPEFQNAHFDRSGTHWVIKEKYKEHVKLVKHNLISDEIPSLARNIFAFDVILCRNVMIYFDREANEALTGRLSKALAESGCLLVAPADFHSCLPEVFDMERAGGATVLRRKAKRLPRSAEPQPARPVIAELPIRHGKVESIRALKASGRRRPVRSRAVGPSRATVEKANGREDKTARLPELETIIGFANRGDWINAAKHCEDILRTDALNVAVHYYHGLVLQYTGAKDEAEQALRRAIYLDRGFALAHYQLGLARKEAKDAAASGKAFRNVIDILKAVPDDRPVSPCDQITAVELRQLAAQQLERLVGS